MSTATKLQRILTAKSDIKTAIEAKGVTVGTGTIDGYAAKIDAISTGEGGSYPTESQTLFGVTFNTDKIGNVVEADESLVVDGTQYGANGTTKTGTYTGVPAGVITQLDTINGEVIAGDHYDKMDAIEASKTAINAALNSTGVSNIGGSDVLSEISESITDLINFTKSDLVNIIGSEPNPSTVNSCFLALNTVRGNIEDAIIAKGVTPDHSTLESYTTAIAAISTGGTTLGLPKTGITTSTVTGDDGDTERGFVGTDLTDNTDNTISSSATGLQWVKEPQKIGALAAKGQWDITHVRTGGAVGYALGDLVKNAIYETMYIGYPYWYSGTTYVTDDSAVQDFGTRYQCKLGHIADDYQPTVSSIYTDAWTQIADWQGGYYSPSTYTTSSYVNNGTDVYHCILGHVSDTYQPMGSVNWEDKWTEHQAYWSGSVTYTAGDLVTNYWTGTPYKCILAHTSDASTEPGSGVDWATYWEVFSNTWTEDTAYTAGDMVVLYVAFYRFFRCDVTHRSSSKAPETSSDWATYWEKVTSSAWTPNETYTTSSYVSYSGMGTSFWKCKLGHVSSTKEPGVATGWQTYWDAIEVTMPGWLTDTSYTVGDKVYKYNGQITQAFECKANHTSTQSAFEPMSAELWSEKWTWIPDYYTCKLAHLSSVDTEPGVGSASSTNWDCAYFTGSAENLTTPAMMDFQGAIQACEALTLAGHSDWHLPNINEMLSIVNYSASPTINSTMFPNTQTMGSYITSSKAGYNLYSVSFSDGTSSTMNNMSAWGTYVRPVRKEV